jgi:hypothetical protein
MTDSCVGGDIHVGGEVPDFELAGAESNLLEDPLRAVQLAESIKTWEETLRRRRHCGAWWRHR